MSAPMHYEAPAKAEDAAAAMLRQYIERVERLSEEAKGISDDIRDVYLEAKSQGFDPKTMRQIVRLRKLTPHDRKEMEALLETYQIQLKMI